MNSLIIYGAGGHGAVVAESAEEAGWNVIGFVDELVLPGAAVCGHRVLSNTLVDAISGINLEQVEVIVAIGDNAIRAAKTRAVIEAGVKIATVVHPRAVIGKSVSVAEGAVVFAGAVINARSVVGRGVIINTGATVDHDSVIGNYAHISPGAHMGGNVVVGSGTHVSIGCSVRNKINIGKWSVVGVGSVVVKDVPDNVVVFGCPAKVCKELH
jgi:sugar O-acyltransferase (sialic acid O-acetyltransferase NeuD family)